MKLQRAKGESTQAWLMRKYGAQIEDLLQRVAKLEKKK